MGSLRLWLNAQKGLHTTGRLGRPVRLSLLKNVTGLLIDSFSFLLIRNFFLPPHKWRKYCTPTIALIVIFLFPILSVWNHDSALLHVKVVLNSASMRSKQIKYTGVHWQEYYGLLGV